MWLQAFELAAIGLVAGAVTTVSGIGGALIAVAATSTVMPARQALAITALALLAGSLHRLWLYRRAVERSVIRRLGPAVVLGSIAGAQLAGSIPEVASRAAVIAVTVVASAVAIARVPFPTHAHSLPASGVMIGLVGAAAGGAALLIGPVLQALGLRGERYLATATAIAVVFNIARGFGYAVSGMYMSTSVAAIALMSAACIAGNIAGAAIRDAIGQRATDVVELAAPLFALVLALAGAA